MITKRDNVIKETQTEAVEFIIAIIHPTRIITYVN